MTMTHPHSSMYKDDASYPSAIASPKKSGMPPHPMQELGRVQTDSMTVAREPVRVQRGGHNSQRRRRVPAIDSRNDDSSYKLSLWETGADGSDSYDDAPKSSHETKPRNDDRDEANFRDGESVSSFLSDVQSIFSTSLPSWVVGAAASDSSTAAAQTERRNIPDDKMAFWSSLSVQVAMAAIKAKGSDLVAKEAANAVLSTGKKRSPTLSLRRLATDVSMVVLEAGGSQDVASAVIVAIMNNGDGSSITSYSTKKNESKKNAKINDRGLQYKANRDESSIASSMAAKRRDLKEKEDEIKQKEDEIKQKTGALLEAERLAAEKETEISEQLAKLDAAEAAFLESVNIDRVVMEQMSLLEFNKFHPSPQDGGVEIKEQYKESETVQNNGIISNTQTSQPSAQGKSKDKDDKSSKTSSPMVQGRSKKPRTKKISGGFSSFKKKAHLFRKKSQV